MKTQPMGHASPPSETSLGRQWRTFDLFRTATTPMLIRAGIAVAVAWIPLVVFSAAHGGTAFLSFLTDYASQSRFLIILPVLILAEPPLQKRHHLVANHFEEFIVPQDQRSQFQAAWSSHEKARYSKLGYFALLLLTYATAAWLSQYLSPGGSEFVLMVDRRRRLQIFLAGWHVVFLCELSNSRVRHSSLVVAATALGAVLTLYHSLEPSADCRSSRSFGRAGLS